MATQATEIDLGPISAAEFKMRQMIRRVLRDYSSAERPLTSSMIGVHIRPYRPWWADVLEKMISEGEIVREMRTRQTARGRRQNVVYYLAL